MVELVHPPPPPPAPLPLAWSSRHHESCLQALKGRLTTWNKQDRDVLAQEQTMQKAIRLASFQGIKPSFHSLIARDVLHSCHFVARFARFLEALVLFGNFNWHSLLLS